MILVVFIALLMLTGILTGTTVAAQANGGDAGSAAAMANSAAWWIIAGANACAVTVLAWFWWRRRSRRAETHHGGRSRRSPWQRLLIVAGILLLVAYAGYVFLRRWNPDEAWAARVIGEALEVQVLLARYHQTNGEYPRSLKDLQGEYLEPTDFLSRHAVLPERGGGTIPALAGSAISCLRRLMRGCRITIRSCIAARVISPRPGLLAPMERGGITESGVT